MLNLADLMHNIEIQGTTLVRIWDDAAEDYSFEKYLDDFRDRDLWVYSYEVRYIYPIEVITNGHRHAATVIELRSEG